MIYKMVSYKSCCENGDEIHKKLFKKVVDKDLAV